MNKDRLAIESRGRISDPFIPNLKLYETKPGANEMVTLEHIYSPIQKLIIFNVSMEEGMIYS
jgi:hypothetical protein